MFALSVVFCRCANTISTMRLSLWMIAACLACATHLCAEEPAHAWPLWDGKETVADYAQRVNLPPTKTLDLGNNVTLELVLIPAGTFVMGTPEPVPVDEEPFRKRVVIGEALLAAGAGTLLVMLAVVVIRAIRRRSWPQVSLAWLIVLSAVLGVCSFGGILWWKAVQELQPLLTEFELAKVRYEKSGVNERPAHLVTLTTPFYMGKYEVTQSQYLQIQGINPSRFQGPNNPVDGISWEDADAYCEKASAIINETFRLPTEAEWEFACRAGTRSVYSSGDQESDLAQVAWYSDNSKKSPHPVGMKAPNAFGLYDMHGNLWEWCLDRYSKYISSPIIDPKGPAIGQHRILRGGSYIDNGEDIPVANRFDLSPFIRHSILGFRIVVSVRIP